MVVDEIALAGSVREIKFRKRFFELFLIWTSLSSCSESMRENEDTKSGISESPENYYSSTREQFDAGSTDIADWKLRADMGDVESVRNLVDYFRFSSDKNREDEVFWLKKGADLGDRSLASDYVKVLISRSPPNCEEAKIYVDTLDDSGFSYKNFLSKCSA